MRTLLFFILALTLNACKVPDSEKSVRSKAEPFIITHEIHSAASDRYELTMLIGDKKIDMVFSEAEGLELLDGHGAILSTLDKAALTVAAERFAKNQGLSAESSFDQQVVYRAMDYLSEAPENFSFTTGAYQKKLSLKNEGVSCIKKGSSPLAEWNTSASAYESLLIEVGTNWNKGYGCMGRCCSDCGGWLPSAWTKDCLDHDACSSINAASGGPSDINCGDEFTEAADDWTIGVVLGCRG